MGFRQKSRGIRFGHWEYLALILAGITVFAGLLWWHSRNTSQWAQVSAQVVGLSLTENNHRIKASRPQLRIHYEYLVQGRRYRGDTGLDAVTRTVYQAVPPEVRELLRSKGYMSFTDLPPELQAMLRRRGIERLDAVPESLMKTLRAQGFKSVRDFPEDMRQMARVGDYEGLREEVERLAKERPPPLRPGAPSSGPPPMRAAGATLILPDQDRFPRADVAPVEEGGLIRIRFNPADPSRHHVVRFPGLHGYTAPAVFSVMVLLTVLYCGFFYPWVKQR